MAQNITPINPSPLERQQDEPFTAYLRRMASYHESVGHERMAREDRDLADDIDALHAVAS